MANKEKMDSLDMNDAISKSEAFINKHKKALIIGFVALIAIVAGIFFANKFLNEREAKAQTQIGMGMQYFNMMNDEGYTKALNGEGQYQGFLKIAKNYSFTDASNLAKAYAGISYAHLGKTDEAIKMLESFSPQSDITISPSVIACLANEYAAKGNLDKAIDTFKKAADLADNDAISPIFLLEAGKLLESQKKDADANALYVKIQKDYPLNQLCMPQAQGTIVVQPDIIKYIERTK